MERNNNSNLVRIFVPITDDIRDFSIYDLPVGITRKDVVWHKYGSKAYPCIVVYGTPEKKELIERMYDTSLKQERRHNRCHLPDGKGGFIRCPGGNCDECEWSMSRYFTTGTISVEKYTEGDDEDDLTHEIAGTYNLEAEVIGSNLLEALIEYLGTFKLGYDDIFRMLLEKEKTTTMAEYFDLPWSTMKDKVKKVLRLAREFIGTNEI